MLFSADRPNPPQPWNPQCVGRAWADGPLGPFVPEPWPADCGLGGVGGALDPQFFRDPLTAQSHEPDVTALLRVCDVHNVPLATNLGTAEMLIHGLGQ